MTVQSQATELAEAVESLRGILAACSEEFELLLVVDAAASDELLSGAKDLADGHDDVRVVRCKAPGRGAGLQCGLPETRLPLILTTDAALDVDEGDVAKLLAQVDQHEVVIGCRTGRRVSLLRRVMSLGYNRFVRTVFGVYVLDCNCPLKLYRRKVFKHIPLASRGLFVEAEMLAKANVLGYRVGEVAVAGKMRPSQQWPAGPGDIALTLSDAFRMVRTFDLEPDPSVNRSQGEAEKPA
jgi:glycosyltransferase involved in cell wall biosynthesis